MILPTKVFATSQSLNTVEASVGKHGGPVSFASNIQPCQHD